jgi:hypothetical protein
MLSSLLWFLWTLYHGQEKLHRHPSNPSTSCKKFISPPIKISVNPKTDKITIKISGDGSKVSRISNFVVLSFSVITYDLTLSSKDENVFCIVRL